jgi:hypothetical protein
MLAATPAPLMFPVTEPQRDATADALTAVERIIAALAIVALIALRVAYASVYRLDSDEPQHLHVVWGWANGLLQYRDLFDNHAPLFQILCAPLFHALGERADIIIPMRLAMIPLYFFDLWCVYKITARLWNARAALWTTALTAFFPTFFFVSAEFRTDDLWIALWLLSLVILTRGAFVGWRAFWFGLSLGATFAASMKTSVLFVALIVAAVIILVLRRISGEPFRFRQIAPPAVIALCGMLIVPGILIGYFASQGALAKMYDCVIHHNMAVGERKLHKLHFKQICFPLCVPVWIAFGHYLLRSREDRMLASRQAVILMTGGLYITALRAYWPLITAQDFLPFLPLLVISLTPCFLWLAAQSARVHWTLRFAPVLVLLTAELTRILTWHPLSKNEVAPYVVHLSEMLRLTDPGDYVMDSKGETIFRKRPFYYVLEGVTIERLKEGLIADDLPQRLVDTSTCVVVDARLRPADHEFVHANYMLVGKKIYVAGKLLGQRSQETFSFTTAIPARYAVISEHGKIQGELDGKPIADSQVLAPGEHQLRLTRGGKGRVALVWAQAAERGFSPFIKRTPSLPAPRA